RRRPLLLPARRRDRRRLRRSGTLPLSQRPIEVQATCPGTSSRNRPLAERGPYPSCPWSEQPAYLVGTQIRGAIGRSGRVERRLRRRNREATATVHVEGYR